MKKIAVAVGIAFLVSGVAYAKPDAVKGAGCPVCHDGPPQKKVLTAKAKEWFEKSGKDTAKCKDCHDAKGGKLTTKAGK